MLENFFKPYSVAVIGASREKRKLGNQVLENLLKAGFPGRIFPINIKAGPSTRILGMKAYSCLMDVPEPVDLAVVVVPSRHVLSVIRDCAAKGTDSVVIISAGFKEVGSAGLLLEEEMLKLSRDSGIRILGPNVLGIIDTHHRLNASFAPSFPPAGNIALLSQSGALGCAILDEAEGKGIGLSKFISLGNKVDLDEIDFLTLLKEDPATEVILGYLEEIERGRDFIKVAKDVASQKPIIMIKAGRSESGKKAVSSHTGSLAGEDEAYDVAFQEAGIIRADSFRQAIDLVRGFSSQKIPQGKRVLFLTNGGGVGIMASDACEKFSLESASLEESTRERLQGKLPAASSLDNPVDILGDAKSDRYKVALEAVASDSNVDGIIILLTPQSGSEEEETAKAIRKVSSETEKTILVCFMGKRRVKKAIEYLRASSIPNYEDPEAAVMVFEAMFRYGQWFKRSVEEIKTFPVNKAKVKSILSKSKKEGCLEIGGNLALGVMEAYGIPVVKSWLVKEAKEALKVAESLASSVVMKIESPAILHKSEAGAVLLDLKTEKVEDAFHKLTERAKRLVGNNGIRGISLQPMVRKGKEALVGASLDKVFGHLIKFGLGGKYVEIYRDVSTRLVPLTPGKAKEMIRETKVISRLLRGVRDEKSSDIALVEEVLLKVSQLVSDFPEIVEIEANPLIVWEKGGVVVDARLALRKGINHGCS